MRILFITDQVDYPAAINPILARRTAGELAKLGHQVDMLDLWDGKTPLASAPQGVTRSILDFSDERVMNTILEHGGAGSPIPLRLAKLLLHPRAFLAAFRQLILKQPRRQIACRKFLMSHPHYDWVVSVGAPYWSWFALAQANIPGKKAVWMMDPYSTNQVYHPAGGTQRELWAGGQMDRIFITHLMEQDYRQGPLVPLAPKTQALEFPCLIPGPKVPPPSSSEEIRLVFCGNLYPNIRQPWPLLELLCRLEDPSIKLTMVGGGWEHFDPAQIREYRQRLGDRLELTDRIPFAQAQQQMARADVLINLGNDVVNQLPSKIFDYFGMGKPILQLATRADDPANDYFVRYPLAHISSPGDDPLALVRWLHSVKGQQLDFDQVESLFYESTPAAVARALAAGLE